jgi:hypothetical protein
MKSRKIVIGLVTVLILTVPAASSGSDTFSIDYTFEPVAMDDQCNQWMVHNTQMLETPGEPVIPYRAARILLPQDALVKDVKVRHSPPLIQKGIEILWGQPPCTFSNTPEKVGKNEEIYNSDDAYPDKLLQVISVESFRGFQVLNVHLFPIQYKPKSQTVKFYETLTVEVTFGKGLKNALYRGLAADKHAVSRLVDNPEMINTYETLSIPTLSEEYIIITNDTLKCIFQKLADYKSCYVNGATVYTVSWIYTHSPGADSQEKIRNFIKNKYTLNGLHYVLLGGDIAVVPYRGFYVSTGGYTDYDMAADMYYAHLDGTFNDDSDSYWAEPGEVDWYADIAVGRAPVETVGEAQDFVDKVIAYELASKPERALLHQARLRPSNDPDSRCLAWNCDDWLPLGYTIDYLFEEDGTVTKDDWRTAWAANPAVVAHIGHGNTSFYEINYEVGTTVTWTNTDVATLTNTFWPWTTSIACISGEIEANDCLAEEYVKDRDNGAIAAIYNDNYGWFSLLNACKYSGEFCEMEFKACWNDGYQKFGEMVNQARSYLVSSATTNTTYRWCFYERNLVGDPETPCLSTRILPTVTITSPRDGSRLCTIVDVTVVTEGCITTVKFYLIYIVDNVVYGELLYVDDTPPFEYVWNTTGHSSGWYTIRAEGIKVGKEVMDVDEITVRI